MKQKIEFKIEKNLFNKTKHPMNLFNTIIKLYCLTVMIVRINPFNIYVLKLAQNKYYIGKTFQDIQTRYNQHVKGIGSKWTKLFRPIETVEFFQTTNKFKEDMITKMYMDKYGIENVRGGSYTKIKLDPDQVKLLKQELCTANNLCFKCGKFGHFASHCKRI